MTDTPTESDIAAAEDAHVERVIAKHRDRAAKGLAKYGVTTERDDLSVSDWLDHLQDELMVAAVYVEALKGRSEREKRLEEALQQANEIITKYRHGESAYRLVDVDAWQKVFRQILNEGQDNE